MHRFIKAAGFPDFIGEIGMADFLERVVTKQENCTGELNIEPGCTVKEYRLMVNRAVGICAAMLSIGQRPARLLYMYPYLESETASGNAECILERHTETETWSGIIDDLAPGISLIFFLTNSLEYRSLLQKGEDPLRAYKGSYLSAFANEGKVLLPVVHDSLGEEIGIADEIGNIGDEIGISDEIGIADAEYDEVLFQRLQTEDLYTVVDQTFIPWGVDCDQYSIVGEISEVEESVNVYTGVPLWILEVTCNGVNFRLAMRKEDLLGEPLPGRRIKCGIWLHGRVNL